MMGNIAFPPAASFRNAALVAVSRDRVFDLSNFAAAALLVTVLFSSLIIGGKHPVLWLFWAFAWGLIALFVLIARWPAAARMLRGQWRLIFASFALIGFAALQIGAAYITQGNSIPASDFGTSSPGATWLAFARLQTFLVVFLFAVHVGMQPRLAQITACLLVTITAFQAVVGLATAPSEIAPIFGFPKEAYVGLATGTFVNHNAFASFAAMGLLLAFGLIGSFRDYRNYFLIGAVIFLAVALFVSQSRMGIASTLFVASLWVTNAGKTNSRVKLMAIGLVVLVVASLIVAPDLAGRAVADLGVRFDLYQQVIYGILEHPLIGFGGGTFPLAFQLFHMPPVSSDVVWQNAHSSYLSFWFEYGLIFGSIPIFLVAYCARFMLARRNYSECPSLVSAALAVLAYCALHATIDFSFEFQANTFLLLAIIGIGMGCAATSTETHEKSPYPHGASL